jgi:hypothetical protein
MEGTSFLIFEAIEQWLGFLLPSHCPIKLNSVEKENNL